MSTYLYLECHSHTPTLQSDRESGQHLYDVPGIRDIYARRSELDDAALSVMPAWVTLPDYFARPTILFFRQHPDCDVRLVTEYGEYLPLQLPMRIQLSRARGWRKPADTVVVARPGRYGNPFRVGLDYPDHLDGAPIGLVADNARAVEVFRAWLDGRVPSIPLPDFDWRAELAGKNLACWCPLTDERGNRVPCHGDVLLDLSNGAN